MLTSSDYGKKIKVRDFAEIVNCVCMLVKMKEDYIAIGSAGDWMPKKNKTTKKLDLDMELKLVSYRA
jgi:hypothetical protein